MFYALIFVICSANAGCDRILVEDGITGGITACTQAYQGE